MFDLCLHIYAPGHADPMLKTFQPICDRVEQILISVPEGNTQAMKMALSHADMAHKATVIGVGNTYNDWAGFLALLGEVQSDRMLFGNDSLINRRLIRKADIVQLADLVENASRPSLIGELDTARASVPVAGYSSAAWVSSFLFGLTMGNGLNAQGLRQHLLADCQSIPSATREVFLAFLAARRRALLDANPDGGGKLYAMYLERLLTHHAAAHEFEIVSQYGGNWNRKVRRLAESKFL